MRSLAPLHPGGQASGLHRSSSVETTPSAAMRKKDGNTGPSSLVAVNKDVVTDDAVQYGSNLSYGRLIDWLLRRHSETALHRRHNKEAVCSPCAPPPISSICWWIRRTSPPGIQAKLFLGHLLDPFLISPDMTHDHLFSLFQVEVLWLPDQRVGLSRALRNLPSSRTSVMSSLPCYGGNYTVVRFDLPTDGSYGVTMARVTTLPDSRPSHSAVLNASSIWSMGNACEITLVSGYLSRVRMRKSMALGMIQGS